MAMTKIISFFSIFSTVAILLLADMINCRGEEESSSTNNVTTTSTTEIVSTNAVTISESSTISNTNSLNTAQNNSAITTEEKTPAPPTESKPTEPESNGSEAIRLLGSVKGANYNFVEYLPSNYEASNNWALIIFLHGIGETNKPDANGKPTNIKNVAYHGPIDYASPKHKNHGLPAVVLAPQAIKGWNPIEIEKFRAFAVAHYKVDPKRVYLTGLSLGGGGTWNYLDKYAANVAAAIPICGTGYLNSTGAVDVVKHRVAIWAAHAEDDPRVKVTNTYKDFGNLSTVLGGPNKIEKPDFSDGASKTRTAHFDQAQKKFIWADGQKVQEDVPDYFYTLYANGGHGIWDRMYNDPQIYDWLFKHRKND